MSNGPTKSNSVLATVAVALLSGGAVGQQVQPLTQKVSFDIARQPATEALTLGQQSGPAIILASAMDGSAATPEIVGDYRPDEALRKLLAHTGLKAEQLDQKTIAIRTAQVDSKGLKQADKAELTAVSPRPSSQSEDDNSSQPNHQTSQTLPPEGIQHHIDTILVTAQKRTERLQDVPVPVTAISAQTLVDSNQLRLQDYYTQAPGLSMATDVYGAPQVVIRGLSTGRFSDPTVGIVIDDVPYGASVGGFVATQVPEVDPSDLASVEVLRGPQGTLYGANSLGGLIKYVTVEPSTDGVSGRVQAGTSSIHNGDGPGYNVRGSVNVPLGDTWAVRASGFARKDPGYINNPVLNIDGINEERVSGGRVSALWKPSPVLSLKLNALVQHAISDGSSYIYMQPGLGDLQQNQVPGTGGYSQTLQAYSVTLAAKIGVLDLTSVSGYNVNKSIISLDYTSLLGECCTLPQFGVTGSPLTYNFHTDKFTQEFRLSVPIGNRIDWLLGAFYDHEDTPVTGELLAADSTTGVPVGTWLTNSLPGTYTEIAAFTDLTFHVTNRVDVQIGGRESRNQQTGGPTVFAGPYVPFFLGVPSPSIDPKGHSKGNNAFTYLVTPRFKVSADLMVYARLASGYRPGGGGTGGPGALCVVNNFPCKYRADTTRNYEVGVKGDILDHALSFDVSVYYINWRDIQLSLSDPQSGFGYTANGGHAKSQGVEFSVEARPLVGLTIATWVAWNDAVLTQDFPTTSTAVGVEGDRLPNSSRLSGNLSLQKDFPLMDRIAGFVGGQVSYVGNREGVFRDSATRQYLPAYARTDLRAGAKYDSWTLNLFVNNVADRRGLLTGGLDLIPDYAFSVIPPRTFGLSVAKTF